MAIQVEIAPAQTDAITGKPTTGFGYRTTNTGFSDSNKFASSEDYQETSGMAVIAANGDNVRRYTSGQLLDTDIVTLPGSDLQVTVRQARELGFNFEEDGGTGSADALLASNEPEDDEPAIDMNPLAANETDVSAEATAGENVVLAVSAATDLPQDAIEQLGLDILNGDEGVDDAVYAGLLERGISREAVHGTVNQVVEIGTKAAQRELTPEQFAWLDSVASRRQDVRNVVLKRGMDRAMGRTRLSWKSMYDLVVKHYPNG
jgi:hypothetical protein